jgi:hypothetical protein
VEQQIASSTFAAIVAAESAALGVVTGQIAAKIHVSRPGDTGLDPCK